VIIHFLVPFAYYDPLFGDDIKKAQQKLFRDIYLHVYNMLWFSRSSLVMIDFPMWILNQNTVVVIKAAPAALPHEWLSAG